MAEYVAAAKGLYFLGKEVYYLITWVQQTVESASHRQREFTELKEKFDEDLEVFTSFGNMFLRDLPSETDEVSHFPYRRVKGIYTRTLTLLREATIVANPELRENEEYRIFSRQQQQFISQGSAADFLIDGMGTAWAVTTLSTTSTIQLAVQAPQQGLAPPRAANRPDYIPYRREQREWRNGLEWALKRKPQLEKLQESMHKETQDLLSLVALAMSSRLIKNSEAQLHRIAEDPRRRDVLGVQGHMQIRQNAHTQAESEQLAPPEPEGIVEEIVPALEDLGDCRLQPVEPTNPTRLVQGKLIRLDNSKEEVLIEYKHWRFVGDQDATNKKEVQRLAEVLASAGALVFPTLKLRGYINQEDKKRSAFIFDFPKGSDEGDPLFLQQEFSKPRSAASDLDSRLRIARILAKGIEGFHADNWVHESICSDTVVFFNNSSSKPMVRQPYLSGFEYSRPTGSETFYASSRNSERRAYQHPERLRSKPVKFRKEHDIYSLGVVLLELGLWKKAVDIYAAAPAAWKDPKGASASDEEMQKVFVKVAESEMPGRMGFAYRDAVCACLSEDHAQLLVKSDPGVEVISKVIELLERKRDHE